MENETRANSIFHLCDLLPDEAARQTLLKTQPAIKKTLPLSLDSKRIIAYTADEANRLKDYWIDTEHMVLGILREGENAAATRLRTAGLDLEASRQRVVESKSSRPPRPNPVLWWARRRPLGMALAIVFFLGVIVALILLGFGGAR